MAHATEVTNRQESMTTPLPVHTATLMLDFQSRPNIFDLSLPKEHASTHHVSLEDQVWYSPGNKSCQMQYVRKPPSYDPRYIPLPSDTDWDFHNETSRFINRENRIRELIRLLFEKFPPSQGACIAFRGNLDSNAERPEYKQTRNERRSELREQLRKWQNTPKQKRWLDTIWPADAAFEEARMFVENLLPSALLSVHMSMAADGEINFSWDTEQVDIDLGFYGTRPCSYYAEDKIKQKDIIGETFDPAEGLPEPLRVFFSS